MADPAPAPSSVPGIPQENTPPRDMSQYIRTFAKDVAELTNQPMPISPPREEVKLPEVDATRVNHSEPIKKDFPQEITALTKEDSVDIYSRPATAPQPVPPPPVDDTKERETVLARLRQKVAAHQAQEAVPPPVILSTPPLAPVPLPPPSTPAFSPFVPPAPQPAPILPLPTPSIGIVPLDAGPVPLHTYTSDFSDRIDQKQASTFTVLAAQSDAGLTTTTTVSTKKRGGLVPIVLAVLLIILGTGGLYAAYRFVGIQDDTEVTLGVPSLIFADEKMELRGPDYRQNLADAATQPLVEGNILITYVTVASSTPLGLKSAPQPGGALIRLLNLGAPDILLRNVDISSTVGIVSANKTSHPFFILRVNSYERTFAGMLGWESRMLTDLSPLYPDYADLTPEPVSIATTTATTSVLVSPIVRSQPQSFTDAIVANIDVRVLKDSFGRTLVLYGYSDKETLVIARDEAAFTALVARLAATRGGE